MLTAETAQLFIDGFHLQPDHAAELRRLLLAPLVADRPVVEAVSEAPFRTLSLQELHILGPDGLPARHHTVHTITAVDEVVDGYTYTFDSSAVAVRAVSGAVGGPIEPSPQHPGYWQCVFRFGTPIRPDEVRIFEYITEFAYDEPPPTEFRRGAARTVVSSLGIRVQFDEARLPSRMRWCEWPHHTDREPVTDEPVELDGMNALHRFVSRLEQRVVGFTWEW